MTVIATQWVSFQQVGHQWVSETCTIILVNKYSYTCNYLKPFHFAHYPLYQTLRSSSGCLMHAFVWWRLDPDSS